MSRVLRIGFETIPGKVSMLSISLQSEFAMNAAKTDHCMSKNMKRKKTKMIMLRRCQVETMLEHQIVLILEHHTHS
jgi:hypothetical protein